MAEAGDRTERATPRRRSEARKKGQVVRSPEVSPVVEFLVALALASWGGPLLFERAAHLLRDWLASVGTLAVRHDAAPAAIGALAASSLLQMGSLLVPFFLAMACVGGGSVLAQVGWSVNPDLVLPDPSRLSPANGLRRIFSLDGAMNLLKSVTKIGLALAVAYVVLVRLASEAVSAPGMTLEQILVFTGYALRKLFLVLVLAFAVLGVADYFWQRWRYEQNLKMSRQEVKEELKETEGDPQIRARFRRAHREIARRRMLTEVRHADVVLTNPIHVAVALRYRVSENAAPRVVAKGAGELAEKIKTAARSAGIPIVERRALARALFRSVKLGAEIPPALYRAVAEILAYIYSVRGIAATEARS